MAVPSSVVVVSDIHGVAPVLEAVLDEPDARSADLIVATGDLAAGPMPVETLDLLTGLGERCVMVRGNADREMVEVLGGAHCPHPESVWAAGQLRPEQADLLARLPHPVTKEVAGFGPVLFCHGTPSSDVDVVLVDTPIDLWLAATADVPSEVHTIVAGHTHMPFVRFVDGRLIVNPGSVGMPYSRPGGGWALLRDGQVSIRHTAVDIDVVCERIIAQSSYPDRREWVDEYVRAVNSDVVALRAFSPRDGRHRDGSG